MSCIAFLEPTLPVLVLLVFLDGQVFPKSRPCDDWFHFKQKKKTLEQKCRVVERKVRSPLLLLDHVSHAIHVRHTTVCAVRQAQRTLKKNVGWIEAALNGIRMAPTLPIFAACWDGLLVRLTNEGEPDVRGAMHGACKTVCSTSAWEGSVVACTCTLHGSSCIVPSSLERP